MDKDAQTTWIDRPMSIKAKVAVFKFHAHMQ